MYLRNKYRNPWFPKHTVNKSLLLAKFLEISRIRNKILVLVYLLILILKDPVNESALFGFVAVKFPGGKTELPGEASATDHFGKLLKGPHISGKAELSLFHLAENVKIIKIAFSFLKGGSN